MTRKIDSAVLCVLYRGQSGLCRRDCVSCHMARPCPSLYEWWIKRRRSPQGPVDSSIFFFPSLPDCHSWPQQQFFNIYQLNRNGPAWWHKEEEANCIHIGQRSHRSSSPARSFLARTHNNLASTSKSVYYYYLRLETRSLLLVFKDLHLCKVESPLKPPSCAGLMYCAAMQISFSVITYKFRQTCRKYTERHKFETSTMLVVYTNIYLV
jgi:hypothetical protein